MANYGTHTTHTSVLLQELVDSLALTGGETVVDATLGGGGHAELVSERIGKGGTLIGIDADADALAYAKKRLAHAPCQTIFVNAVFGDIASILETHNISKIDAAYFDLGLSSFQLAESGRGFSFQSEEPLHMTFGTDAESAGITAADIVNTWPGDVIAETLSAFADERYARAISRGIIGTRAVRPITTTTQLAEIIKSAVPPTYRNRKVHPATKTFQALRMAVNREMDSLDRGLNAAHEHMTSGGRISVITFHSVEDRLVKQRFRSWQKNSDGVQEPKRPLTPTEEELAANPRARSAKLRTFIHTQ